MSESKLNPIEFLTSLPEGAVAGAVTIPEATLDAPVAERNTATGDYSENPEPMLGEPMIDPPRLAAPAGERPNVAAMLVPLARLRPNPNQPRRQFDEETLDDLAENIRERGVLQPLVVQPHPDGGYRIIIGERRYRAAVRARLPEVPVIVQKMDDDQAHREMDDDRAFLDALVENLHREDLRPEDEAEAYGQLLARGLGVRQIADLLKLPASRISRALSVQKNPVLSEAVQRGRIKKSQAQELLPAPPEAQSELVEWVVERREQGAPVSPKELRAKVARARARATDGGAEPDAGVAVPPNQPLPFGLVVAQSIDVAVNQATEHARTAAQSLKREVEARLAPLAAMVDDPVVASELACTYRLLERALKGYGLPRRLAEPEGEIRLDGPDGADRPSDDRRVQLGSRVLVQYEDGASLDVAIVNHEEARPVVNIIAAASPLGRAILGAREGERRMLSVEGKPSAVSVRRLFPGNC